MPLPQTAPLGLPQALLQEAAYQIGHKHPTQTLAGENNKTLHSNVGIFHIGPEWWNLMHNLDYEMGHLSLAMGFDSRQGQWFLSSPLHPDWLCSTCSLLFNRHLGVMRPQRAADLSTTYSTGVKSDMQIHIFIMWCSQTRIILPLITKRKTLGIRYILYYYFEKYFISDTKWLNWHFECAHFHYCYVL
jgi:hypothetical protein